MTTLWLQSCKKLEEKSIQKPDINKTSAVSTDASGNTIFDVLDNDPDYSNIRYTTLGAQYNFPFKTETIKQAWNNLSENQITTLQPTHNYIRFNPQNMEELAELLASDLRLFDFPLDYEIIEMGDVLQGTGATDIPTLYTFAPVGTTLPNVSNTTLYTVYFTAMESVVTEEAFALAGLSDKYPYDRTTESDPSFDTLPMNIYDIVYFPSGWTPQASEPYTGGPGGYNVNDLEFNKPTPDDVTNACGCTHSIDYRKPSGCILVEETQFAPHWQGVRKVLVDYVGPYGQYELMRTNEKGCYSRDRKIHYKVHNPFGSDLNLPVFMRVMFQSGEATVRSLIPGTLFLAVQPSVHVVGNIASWSMDNNRVRYNRSTNAYQLPNVYYYAATANNAHYEYKEMSAQDGITPMHSDIHYLVHPYDHSGSAPMLRQMIKNGSPTSIISQGVTIFTISNLPPASLGWSVEAYLKAVPPDIAFGTDAGAPLVAHSSDQMREVMYHEMGHATHYRKTGNQFWRNLIDYEAHRSLANINDPYGDGTVAGWDKCALAEMWGYHIGYIYTHRRYGQNHSWGTDPFLNSWYEDLEGTAGWNTNSGALNWSWIPVGLLLDLMDNNLNNLAVSSFINDHPNLGPSPGTLDNVSGFTNLMFYNELGAANIWGFRDNLRTNQLPATGSSLTSYNTIMSAYGL